MIFSSGSASWETKSVKPSEARDGGGWRGAGWGGVAEVEGKERDALPLVAGIQLASTCLPGGIPAFHGARSRFYNYAWECRCLRALLIGISLNSKFNQHLGRLEVLGIGERHAHLTQLFNGFHAPNPFLFGRGLPTPRRERI